MYRKHSFEEKLNLVNQVLSGTSLKGLCRGYGIDKELVKQWVLRYKRYGEVGLRTKTAGYGMTPAEKEQIVREYLEIGVPLHGLCLKYDVNRSSIKRWVRDVREHGYASLGIARQRGRPSNGMGRPKKKEPQTELERLQAENLRLRAENALLKKVKALVEEEQKARARFNGQKPSMN